MARAVALAGIAVAAALAAGLGGAAQDAHAAQLSAFIDPGDEASPFSMTYQRTVFIEYEEGGALADILRGSAWKDTLSESTPHPDVVELRDRINEKIAADGSGAYIEDMSVEYSAALTGRALNAAIDYRVHIEGTLGGYNIAAEGGVTGQRLVDIGWRGMTVDGPVEIGGDEVNLPISAIDKNERDVHSYMVGTEAEDLLESPLIDADGIRDQPHDSWHFLFDPTGIGVDAAQFGISEEIQGYVVSIFTMGESSFREGIQEAQDDDAPFEADRAYNVRVVQPPNSASLSVVGFANRDSLGPLEILGVTPTAPEGYATTSTGDFPVAIIYGMAGLAAVGGGAFLVFSNRKLKGESSEQTGIDPSRLTAYQTSASSGGYQTNRAEAQLTDSTDYNQTRSVYDEADPSAARGGGEQPQAAQEYGQYQYEQAQAQAAEPEPEPAQGGGPQAQEEASCGCAASADAGSECDCEMQVHCLCDATCMCKAQTCVQAVSEMR